MRTVIRIAIHTPDGGEQHTMETILSTNIPVTDKTNFALIDTGISALPDTHIFDIPTKTQKISLKPYVHEDVAHINWFLMKMTQSGWKRISV